MDNKLDYYIVESIFQYVFNNKISEKLEYLNPIISQYEKELNIMIEKSKPNKKLYIVEIIDWFKKNFFTKKPDDIIQELVEKIINDNIDIQSQKEKKLIEENEILKKKIKELKLNQNNLKNEKNLNLDFNEDEKEKEKILIEQTINETLDLHKKNIPELKKLATDKGLKYNSKIKKDELIKLNLSNKD